MKINIKKILITIATTLSAILIVSTVTYAVGTLTPAGTEGDDTQYSLNDIYNKLIDFTEGATEGSGTMVVPESITATFSTLSEIYALLEAENTDLIAENIAEGVDIFGVEGTLSTSPPTLEWSTNQGLMSWSSAVSICSGTVDGTTGWRLPTIEEYLSITDFTRYNNATQVPNFTPSTYYWSNTEMAGSPGDAWRWRSSNGSIYFYDKTYASYGVRCVR